MKNYTYDTALAEARRCLTCNDAPCHKGCPASVNPRRFIRKIRFEDFAGAVRLLREANILAGSAAYICPCLATCGSECVSDKLSTPIDISGLQRWVMDWERENGMIEPEKPKHNGKQVAVVGSGPAGLSCAAKLAAMGYKVEVFEKEKTLGGQLTLSIPEFRLPKKVVDFEIDFIKKLGVKFHTGKKVDDICHLKEKFDAVFVATGLMGSKKLHLKGDDKTGVYDALDFLMRSKRGDKIELGKRVLVVGGGDTAIDSARVAARAGAQVLLLYRRTQEDMPAYRPDIQDAWDEGVEFWYRVIPVEVVGEGSVGGLKVKRVSWKGRGREAKEYEVEGPEFVIKGDTVINAIGQEREADFGFAKKEDGTIKCELASLKVKDGIFVGGDFAGGPGTAVAAIGLGARAADEIEKYITKKNSRGDKRLYYPAPKADLSVDFCGVHFENPFILAAAPPTDDPEMLKNAFRAGWAGAVLKTTSVENTSVDLKYPMMWAMDMGGGKMQALGNIDLISEHHIDVVEERVKILKKEFPNKVVIASIMGSKKEEWQSLVKRLSDAGVDMIECSFSCPQGSLGAKPGQMLAQDPLLTRTVAGWVKEAAAAHTRNVPVVIKITPHVTDIAEVAEAVKAAGCDAVCASNTIQSLMGIDLGTWIPNPNVEGKSTYSGLSGPSIRPMTLKVISEIARKVGIPITGTGGPEGWKDAVQFMLAGATTVQFCTAVMHFGYDLIEDLISGTAEYLEKKKLKSVSELIGRALPHIVSHEELTYKKKVVSKIDYEKCIRDDLCYIACRDGGHLAIDLGEDRKPKVDEEKCVGCGLCRLVCPVHECIKIEKK